MTPQQKRLLAMLQKHPVTCLNHIELGIAGSALPRRIKELKLLGYNIEISKHVYVNSDGVTVRISKYILEPKK